MEICCAGRLQFRKNIPVYDSLPQGRATQECCHGSFEIASLGNYSELDMTAVFHVPVHSVTGNDDDNDKLPVA
jgi:hypothetical protein